MFSNDVALMASRCGFPRKKTTYNNIRLPARTKVVPLVFDTLGAINLEGQGILRKIVARVAEQEGLSFPRANPRVKHWLGMTFFRAMLPLFNANRAGSTDAVPL